MEELFELLKAKPSRVVLGTPSEREREEARKEVEGARRSSEPAPVPKRTDGRGSGAGQIRRYNGTAWRPE